MSSLVSVVMSVHNGLPYVRAAVESVLRQTYRPLELVVVDDGSTDGSSEALAGVKDQRLVLLTNSTRRGLAASLNRGILSSRGHYIGRLDADDLAHPRRLEAQVAFLEKRPDFGLVGTWYEKVGPKGEHLGQRRLPCSPRDIRWALLFYSPFVHSAILMRRSALEEVGLYEESLAYSMDYELWLRLAGRFEVANLPEYLTTFRVGHSSMTTTYGDLAQEGDRIARERLAVRLGWPSASEEIRQTRLEAARSVAFGGQMPAGPRAAFTAGRDVVRARRSFHARPNAELSGVSGFRLRCALPLVRRAAMRPRPRNVAVCLAAAAGLLSPSAHARRGSPAQSQPPQPPPPRSA